MCARVYIYIPVYTCIIITSFATAVLPIAYYTPYSTVRYGTVYTDRVMCTVCRVCTLCTDRTVEQVQTVRHVRM